MPPRGPGYPDKPFGPVFPMKMRKLINDTVNHRINNETKPFHSPFGPALPSAPRSPLAPFSGGIAKFATAGRPGWPGLPGWPGSPLDIK